KRSCARFCALVPMSLVIAAMCQRASSSPNTSTSPTPSSTGTRPGWSTPCSTRSHGSFVPGSSRRPRADGFCLKSVRYERQGDGAAKIRCRIPNDLIGRKMVFGHAFEKTLHCDRGDEPRHLAAEAEVLAGAKAEMALRPAIDVVDIRVGKFPPIAIAGA